MEGDDQKDGLPGLECVLVPLWQFGFQPQLASVVDNIQQDQGPIDSIRIQAIQKGFSSS